MVSTRVGLPIIGLVALNIALPVFAIGVLLFALDRGFDITDEAFTILNAWYPHEHVAALNEFGHYLNLLVLVVGRNVASLRLIGLMGLLLIGAFFALQLVQFCRERLREEPTWPEMIVLASGTIFAAFGYYHAWAMTPSYNWFAVAGATLVAIGGLMTLRWVPQNAKLADAQPTSFSTTIMIGACIGVGGIFAFIGRPTSALALGFITCIWFVLAIRAKQRLQIGGVAVGIFIAFLIAHVWWFEESWTVFVKNLETAREFGADLDGGHTIRSSLKRAARSIVKIPEFLFHLPIVIGFCIVGGGVSLALRTKVLTGLFVVDGGVSLALHKRDGEHNLSAWESIRVDSIVYGFAAFIALGIVLTIPWQIAGLLGTLGLQANIFLATMFVFNLLGLSPRSDGWLGLSPRHLSRRGAMPIDVLLLMLLFSAAALASSFGSNTPLIWGAGWAFLLYSAAAMVAAMEILPRRFRLQRIILLSLITSPMIYVLVSKAASPYGMVSGILGQTERIAFLDSTTFLRVDPATARWVNDVKRIALNAGWQPGTPLIDLTGSTPGIVVVLAGRAPTKPWLFGGYAGSTDYARKALSLADKDLLKSAWILTAPKGFIRITPEVLTSVGLVFPNHYSLAGRVRTGYRSEEQFLWKPKKQSQ